MTSIEQHIQVNMFKFNLKMSSKINLFGNISVFTIFRDGTIKEVLFYFCSLKKLISDIFTYKIHQVKHISGIYMPNLLL